MKVADSREMFDYNYWANRRILQKAELATPEQFVAPSSHSYSSLQGTLLHLLYAERSWRLLLEGHGLAGFDEEPSAADYPDVPAIRRYWDAEEQAMRAYLDQLGDGDMTTIVRYQVPGGILRERVLWHCLFHVVNHGMQHRSEAAILLTDYGHSPGDIDFTVYLNERAALPRVDG